MSWSDWDDGDWLAYDLNDPKHPTFHERYADAADLARKRKLEQAIDDQIEENEARRKEREEQ